MVKDLSIVTTLPGLIIAKDSRSKYLAISQDFAKLLGWASAAECAGKTDYDIPCKAAEFANQFIKLDQQVIESNQKMLALDIQQYSCGWKLILVERNPFTLENEVGLFNHCVDVSSAHVFKGYFSLHQLDQKYLNSNQTKPVSYILNSPHSPLPLTAKQEECLFFLIRGKTFKEIAKLLRVSPRTIEGHIEAVKNKLRCQCKSELIELAINSGFLYFVPDKLQQGRLAEIL